MKIQNKLILGLSSLVLISLLSVAFISNAITAGAAENTISSLTQDKLETILQLKKRQIESYLNGLRKQVQLMANDQNIASANFHFFSTFDAIKQSSRLNEQEQNQLKKFIKDEHLLPYQKTTGKDVSLDSFYKGLDENAELLLYHYLYANTDQANRRAMESATNEFSSYSSPHAGYHRSFVDYAEKLGFEDIYLIGPDGRVYYSLNKGFELGTSLNEGPFSDSGLARVFKKALTIQAGDLAFDDLNAYAPQLNEPAGFIATPFIKFKRVRGVMVVQFPIDTIDAIMTDDEGWKSVGLGNSGEAYLLGSDATYRSSDRLGLEDFEAYLTKLEASKTLTTEALSAIAYRGNGIGLQIEEPGIAVLSQSNERGFSAVPIGSKKMLVAYSPITVEGFDWSIISKQRADEAFAGLDEMTTDLKIALAILTLVILVIALITSLILARVIFRPILAIAENMHQLSKGEASLSSRLDDNGNDELARLARGFNRFVSKIEEVVTNVINTATALHGESNQLSALSEQGKRHAQDHSQQMADIDNSIKQITLSVEENARHAAHASEAASQANDKAQQSRQTTKAAIEAIQTVEKEVQATANTLSTLETDVQSVSEVLAVINSISDQTNLLALNAAIEAARAGAHGRGFAVVADEVRSLSYKIQSETHQIYETINTLSQATSMAVTSMGSSSARAIEGANLSADAGKALTKVVSAGDDIMHINLQVASMTEEQSCLVKEIRENIESAESISRESAQAADDIHRAGKQVEYLSDQLQEAVSQFTRS
jgi:methyl-accepting chemotaxis protein